MLKYEEKTVKESKQLSKELKVVAREVGRRLVEKTKERVEALEELKKWLCNAPTLRYPDFSRLFTLYIDTSGKGIGGALYQTIDGHEHPVLFISCTLSPGEKNYSAMELECLGVYWSFSKLAHYIDRYEGLTMVTDHHVLQWLWNVKQATNSRIHHWAMLLNSFQSKVKIIHRPGLAHSNVDPLSRFPVQAWTSAPTWISLPNTLTAETTISRDSMCSRLQDAYESDED